MSNNNLNDLLLNENNNSLSEWEMIESLGWYWASQKDDCDYQIANILLEKYDYDDILNLRNFVTWQREQLYQRIMGYILCNFMDDTYPLNMTIFTLASNIVGMGEVMYNYLLDNPDRYADFLEDFQDIEMSFEDCFDVAIFEY